MTGDEGRGKTTLLRTLAGELAPLSGQLSQLDALWLDLQLPGQDHMTAPAFWQLLQGRHPKWNISLQGQLAEALDLGPHLNKRLDMLSTGSRRKVGLVGLLSSGVSLTCIDQPYVSLDLASVKVVRDFLSHVASHTSRGWVVADYEADPDLQWGQMISLD